MKKLHTYILAGLIFGATANAINYQALDHRPDFINLSPQQMSDEHRRQAIKGIEEAAIDTKYFNFNSKGLNVIKGEKGKFIQLNKSTIAGHSFSVQLPGLDFSVLLNVDSVQNLIQGKDITTYVGHVSDDTNDTFVISVSDRVVMGNIKFGKYTYQIAPLNEHARKHVIVQIDRSLIIKDTSDDMVEGDVIDKSSKDINKSSNGSGNVEVLFYAASDIFWPSYQISNIVAYTNGVLSGSGVSNNNYISSVGIKVLNSSLSGLCKYPIANQINNRQGVFSSLDSDLASYGADMMFLLITTQTTMDCSAWNGGLSGDNVPWGRRGGVAYRYTSSQPYAVSTHTFAINDLTAVHEIGHVLNGYHSSEEPSDINNRGFTDSNGNWQTIMGGYGLNGCYFSLDLNNMDCERIGYFSNPSKSYNGVTIGNSSRNMTSYLHTSMPVVSGWRSAPTPPPSIPNPISSTNEACYGLNTINWTAQTGASSYQLYRSTSSNFTNPYLIYSGSNTSKLVNLKYGTWYLRAKACNSTGCSAYSNQVTAYRISSCL